MTARLWLLLALWGTACAPVLLVPGGTPPSGVDVLVIPDGMPDPVTVAPIASQETAISGDGDGHCNRDPAPDTEPGARIVNPTWVEIDDPFTAGRVCRVPLPHPLPTGTFRAATVFVYTPCVQSDLVTCRSERAFPMAPFTVTCDPSPITLDVGEWTRTIPAGGYGRVTYSLLGSTLAVTDLIVTFNGTEMSHLTASDLRPIAGSYFPVGKTPGTYAFSVEARDISGCAVGGDRPMTIEVQ